MTQPELQFVFFFCLFFFGKKKTATKMHAIFLWLLFMLYIMLSYALYYRILQLEISLWFFAQKQKKKNWFCQYIFIWKIENKWFLLQNNFKFFWFKLKINLIFQFIYLHICHISISFWKIYSFVSRFSIMDLDMNYYYLLI